MAAHLTIKNENRPNPRTATPAFSLVIVVGDMIWGYKQKNKGSAGVKMSVKRGLWSRLGFCVFIAPDNTK